MVSPLAKLCQACYSPFYKPNASLNPEGGPVQTSRPLQHLDGRSVL